MAKLSLGQAYLWWRVKRLILKRKPGQAAQLLSNGTAEQQVYHSIAALGSQDAIEVLIALAFKGSRQRLSYKNDTLAIQELERMPGGLKKSAFIKYIETFSSSHEPEELASILISEESAVSGRRVTTTLGKALSAALTEILCSSCEPKIKDFVRKAIDQKDAAFHKESEDKQRYLENKRAEEELREREKKLKEAMLFCPKCKRETSDFITKDKDFEDGWITHTYYYCAACHGELQDGFGQVRVEISKR